MTENNPFLKIKVRNLLIWFIVSIPFTMIVALLMGIILGIFLYLSQIEIGTINFNDPLINILIQYLWLYGVISIWIYEKIQRSQLSFKSIVGQLPRDHKWVRLLLLAIPILLFSLGSGQTIYYLISLFNADLFTALSKQKIFFTSAETAAPFLYNSLQLITIILIAPIAEEVLFRGILFQRLSVKWGVILGTLISSFIFALLHLNFIGLFNFGLIMALVYLKTRTLLIPILLHILNNLIAIAFELSFSIFGSQATTISPETIQSQWWIGLVYMGLSLPWLIFFYRYNWPVKQQIIPYFVNKQE